MQQVGVETFHLCTPKTDDLRRGMRWFLSLIRHLELEQAAAPTDESEVEALRQSIQLYRLFAETNDWSYLEMCEDFLQHTLGLD
jgi:hypothetical protein